MARGLLSGEDKSGSETAYEEEVDEEDDIDEDLKTVSK